MKQIREKKARTNKLKKNTGKKYGKKVREKKVRGKKLREKSRDFRTGPLPANSGHACAMVISSRSSANNNLSVPIYYFRQYVQPCLSKNPKYTFDTIKSSLTLAYYMTKKKQDNSFNLRFQIGNGRQSKRLFANLGRILLFHYLFFFL